LAGQFEAVADWSLLGVWLWNRELWLRLVKFRLHDVALGDEQRALFQHFKIAVAVGLPAQPNVIYTPPHGERYDKHRKAGITKR
jgi:hypothetical protein